MNNDSVGNRLLSAADNILKKYTTAPDQSGYTTRPGLPILGNLISMGICTALFVPALIESAIKNTAAAYEGEKRATLANSIKYESARFLMDTTNNLTSIILNIPRLARPFMSNEKKDALDKFVLNTHININEKLITALSDVLLDARNIKGATTSLVTTTLNRMVNRVTGGDEIAIKGKLCKEDTTDTATSNDNEQHLSDEELIAQLKAEVENLEKKPPKRDEAKFSDEKFLLLKTDWKNPLIKKAVKDIKHASDLSTLSHVHLALLNNLSDLDKKYGTEKTPSYWLHKDIGTIANLCKNHAINDDKLESLNNKLMAYVAQQDKWSSTPSPLTAPHPSSSLGHHRSTAPTSHQQNNEASVAKQRTESPALLSSFKRHATPVAKKASAAKSLLKNATAAKTTAKRKLGK